MTRFIFRKFITNPSGDKRLKAILFDNATGQEIEVNYADLQTQMSKGVEIDGLRIDNGGIKIASSPNPRRSDDASTRIELVRLREEVTRLSSQIRTLDNTELERGISDILSAVTNLQLPTSITDTDLALVQDKLDIIGQTLLRLEVVLDSKFNSLDSKFDTIEQQLERQGRTIDSLVEDVKERFNWLFDGKTGNGDVKYPRVGSDTRSKMTYYPADITKSEADFNKYVCNKSYVIDTSNKSLALATENGKYKRVATKFHLDYSEPVITALRGHIEVINSHREKLDETLTADKKGDIYKEFNSKTAKDLNSVVGLYGFFLAKMIEGLGITVFGGELLTLALITSTLKPIIGSMGAVARSLKVSLNVGDNIHQNAKDHRTNTGNGFMARQEGLYNTKFEPNSNTFLAITGDIKSDPELYEQYVADLSLFMINLGCLEVQRAMLDFKGTHKYGKQRYKDKPYYSDVRGSLVTLPPPDERLFNFCVMYWYRASVGNKMPSKGKFDDNPLLTTSETDIKIRKAHMSMFINAYFGAKRFFLGNSDAQKLYALLDTRADTVLAENRQLYLKFLAYVKYGLVIQGMRDDYADLLIMLFIEHDSMTVEDELNRCGGISLIEEGRVSNGVVTV